jgi:uncharacterized protein
MSGETLNAPEMWQQHFQAHRQQTRKIDDAPLAMPEKVGRSVRGRSID